MHVLHCVYFIAVVITAFTHYIQVSGQLDFLAEVVAEQVICATARPDSQQTGFKGNLRLLMEALEQPHLPFKILPAAVSHVAGPCTRSRRISSSIRRVIQNIKY